MGWLAIYVLLPADLTLPSRDRRLAKTSPSLPSQLLNRAKKREKTKKGNDITLLFHDWNCINYHWKASRQETAKGEIEDCTLESTPCSKKKRRLFIKRVIFIPRYQCSICSLFRIFFRATMQAETFVKIGVLASHWTKICPSLFECAENTFFHIFVIFNL